VTPRVITKIADLVAVTGIRIFKFFSAVKYRVLGCKSCRVSGDVQSDPFLRLKAVSGDVLYSSLFALQEAAGHSVRLCRSGLLFVDLIQVTSWSRFSCGAAT
jgi:hypothetical protein